MSAFKYPPPPPPPPKAAPNPSQEILNGLQGGRGGRGGFRARGRGSSQRGDSRGGFPGGPAQNGLYGNAPYHQVETNRYGMQHPMHGNNSFQPNLLSSAAGFGQSAYNLPQTTPHMISGSFGPPQFATTALSAWPQVNGYAATQWGPAFQQNLEMQSFGLQSQQNHLQNQQPSTGSATYSSQPQNVPHHVPNYHDSSSSLRGQKRKFGDGHVSRTTDRGRVKKQFINRPKPLVAPAVPSFGAPLPLQRATSVAITVTANDEDSNGKERQRKRKRKTNQLGLTPQREEYEDSEEEVDEESVFSAQGGPLQIEYKGKVAVLGSAADIAAWIEERRKRWPTRARVEEAQKEMAKRREEHEKARKKVQESRALEQAKRICEAEEQQRARKTQAEQEKKENRELTKRSKDASIKKALEKHLAKAEKLRKKIEKSEAKAAKLDNAAAACALAETIHIEEDGNTNAVVDGLHSLDARIVDGVGAGIDQNLEAEVARSSGDKPVDSLVHSLAATTEGPKEARDDENEGTEVPFLSDSSTSDVTSDSDSDSDSSISAPDQHSSKTKGPVRVSPPKREASKRICRYFLARGHCTAGDACQFRHELPERGQQTQKIKRVEKVVTKERKTLFQRLVEQEQAEENRQALQAIKYLGQHGFFEEISK